MTNLTAVEGQIRTPFGAIPMHQLKRYSRLTGHWWDDETEEWRILCDEVMYWHLANPGSTNESTKWKKKEGLLPIRDLNFQYAYYKNKADIAKAMDYAEEKLFHRDGTPCYLPDELAGAAGLDTTERNSDYNYNKIIEKEKQKTSEFDLELKN